MKSHRRKTGGTRLCYGRAWRFPRTARSLIAYSEKVRAVRNCGMEACRSSLGLLTADKASGYAKPGAAYIPNLDTSREFTRRSCNHPHSYAGLDTLRARRAGAISVLLRGIIEDIG